MRAQANARSRRDRRGGQVLLMVTFALVAMIGMIGLVTDLGYAHFIQWKAQAAADAAAVGAAEATLAAFGQTQPIACGSNAVCQSATACPNPVPSTPSNNLGNGCLYAQQNGFVAGGNQNVTMTSNITSPPPTAPGMTVNYWVTVRVTQSVPQFFSAVLGNTTATVAARATAAVLGSSTGPCVYALDPSAANAISATSGASLSVSCAVDVDSSNAQAISVTSGASITASGVNVVGNYVVNSGGSISPSPATGVASVNDPEAAVSAPSYAAVCDFTNYSVVAGHSATVIPGVYCNGININSGATASFNSGVYILMGGGLQITSGATVTGTGVGFYNTANGYTYQPITMSSGATVSLSAASSGAMANMLFFEDRSIVSSAVNTLSSGASGQFNGVLYFPNSPVSYSSGSSSNWGYTTLVAKTVSFTSGSYFHTYTATSGGLGYRQAALVE